MLAQKLNRDPLPAEIAAESGLTLKRVHELLDLVEDPVSLETPVGEGDSFYGDLIEDANAERPEPRSPSPCAAPSSNRPRAAERSHAARAGAALRPHERASRSTLEEVGDELGVTRERVRQLETRALRELQPSRRSSGSTCAPSSTRPAGGGRRPAGRVDA